MSAFRTRMLRAIAAAALAVGVWGFVAQTRLAAVPPDLAPDRFRFPAVFQGVPVGSFEEVRILAEPLRIGDEVEITTPTGASLRTRLVAARTPPGLGFTLASGLLFLAVAALVFAPRVREPAVGEFYGATILYGTSVLIGGVTFPAGGALDTRILNVLQLACLAFLPVLFFRLCLRFPRSRPFTGRVPLLLPALWCLAAATVVWQLGAFERYFGNPAPATAAGLALPQRAADFVLVAQVAAGMAVLVSSYRKLELTRERLQVKWVLWGIVVGVTPYVFLRTLPQVFGVRPLLSADFDRFFELAIPVAFVFAATRHRFLDIDIIIRRSLIYGLLAAAAVAVYLFAAALVGSGIAASPPGRAWWTAVLLGLVAGAMFMPLKRRIGRWVDRTFFKLRSDYDRLLDGFRRRMLRVGTVEELADALAGFLRSALRAGNVEVHLPAVGAPTSLPAGQFLAAPRSTSLPEKERSDFPEDWLRAGFVLAAPIAAEGRPCGLVRLTRRTTERLYIDSDLDCFVRAVEAAEAALDRILLARRAAEEAMARQRTEELARMKDEFLARVAHDLRTPLASITWSSENLLDGVVGPLTDEQKEYVAGMQTSAAYLNRLVSNLLEISRLERGEPVLEISAVDVGGSLARAAGTLAPLARSRRVSVRIEVAADLPAARADPDRLHEALVNLVDNAIKYSPDAGTVDLSARPGPEGRVEISVRDRGPGLPAGDPRRLFDRYAQGTPSPHSGAHGFGLGLHVVREFIERMDGTVGAADHPEGGAVFICTLPAAPTPEGASA